MNTFQKTVCCLPAAWRKHRLLKFLIRLRPSLRQSQMWFNGGARAVVDLRDGNARQCFRTGAFEPEFFALASPLIPPKGTFFDVGANFGLCTYGMCAVRPGEGIRFFLFEANPVLVECLRLSRGLNRAEDCRIAHGCVLDREGFSTLTFDMEHTGGGRVAANGNAGIPHVILDRFIAENQIKCVDLMKIDIEGVEPRALQGARESLARGVIKAIYIEISTEHLGRHGFQPSDCLRRLTEADYKLFWCKAADFEAFPKLQRARFRVDGHAGSLDLAPADLFPENYQTDLLAVHPASPLTERIEAAQREKDSLLGTNR